RCAFHDRDCRLDDGLPELLAAMRQADAVVLGSPTYVLGATGVLKNLQDRLIRYGHVREFLGKPGIALAAAGVPGWEPFALPQISQVFLFLGMPVVDQFVGYGQGPGEILLAPAALERAEEAGAALGRGEARFRGEPGACPVCRFDLVTLRPDGSAYCPLCDLPGSWVEAEGGFRFVPAAGARSRWSEGVLLEHFGKKILPSRARFKATTAEIRARLRAFREGGEP
ncbi:MAG: NAD(P)H-dependent oxidoreductase, partial [Deltaproteobacteria bacterium]|nr:NAD(P)H-dependent oxidoreductase [Deltaproteobacteria bacterium]